MIFISNIKSSVPIKLCKTSGSIHLFKLKGSLQMMEVLLKIRTKTGDYMFREDVYTCTLKYDR